MNGLPSDVPPPLVDFTRQHWGHALHPSKVDDARGILKGSCHHPGRVEVGGSVQWTVASGAGRAVGVFTEVEQLRDPPDMYFITVRVDQRIDSDGVVQWQRPSWWQRVVLRRGGWRR